MDIFRDEIERIVCEQRNLLASYTNEYRRCFKPDDGSHLVCCRNNGKHTYYRAYRENGRRIRKSISRDQDAINALARKEYLRIAIDSLRSNLDALDASCNTLRDLGFETIRAQMSGAYTGLPEESFFANRDDRYGDLSAEAERRTEKHREWGRQPYEKSTYRPEGLRFLTSAGFRVRSKSEQHIVEQLVNHGVPFRYEQVIHINDRKYSADFTFRDRNMELFYWEHAGMMDSPGYAERHSRKMDIFERIGIVPWKNLIITYDIDGVINVPMIKGIIESDVIPRL